MVAPCIILTPVFFRYWIGPDFALVSAPVAQILFIGAWISGLSFVAYTLAQSQGRPDLTGKLHAAELLPFLGILWLLTANFGLKGAATAWTLRGVVDAFAMFWVAGFSRRDVSSALARPAAVLFGSEIATRFVGPSLALSLPAAIVAGLISAGIAYAYCDDLRQIIDQPVCPSPQFWRGSHPAREIGAIRLAAVQLAVVMEGRLISHGSARMPTRPVTGFAAEREKARPMAGP